MVLSSLHNAWLLTGLITRRAPIKCCANTALDGCKNITSPLQSLETLAGESVSDFDGTTASATERARPTHDEAIMNLMAAFSFWMDTWQFENFMLTLNSLQKSMPSTRDVEISFTT